MRHLAKWEDRRPYIGLGQPPYSIIVKRRQWVEPICAIEARAYFCVGAEGLLLHKGPGSQEVLRRPCSVPLRHGGILNSRRAVSPLVWLEEGGKKWEAPGHLQGFLTLNLGGTEQNRTVTCMVLKAKTNNRRKYSSP
ncbi:uncharacterized protein TNCV_2423081 [Trichonephila clavipes]|nr:uncharacterized protein TNCV_2423081 [Trichonephila clavipes]